MVEARGQVLRVDIGAIEGYFGASIAQRRSGADGLNIHKLDQNENPYSPSSLAAHAIAAFSFGIQLYPDASCKQICEAIGSYVGRSTHILCGYGAIELINFLQ
jgi:histidinol-phosphate/aromatic aminotransferase/cobyric acid decarboxylase-like protein